jgi:uncharacterized protein (TIGR03790 family)
MSFHLLRLLSLQSLWLLIISFAVNARANELDAAAVISFSKPGMTAEQLGVIVNDADPYSIEIAKYYQEKRAIPDANMIHVRFTPNQPNLAQAEFTRIKRILDKAASTRIQAYALTWTQPYRVDCMSITAAFAFGFDKAYCASGCKLTKPSPYFNSNSSLPYTSLKIRPSMSLASRSVAEAKELIDRGVASDEKNPDGTAYLVSTDDTHRNVRANGYEKTQALLRIVIPTEIVKANYLEGKQDVMFYFTGLSSVPHIKDNTYLPGAMADHLTSAGGALLDKGQMSSLDWLEAGATGSYGAVVEPCNFPQKFPLPAVAMAHYLQGESLIEAYWKSVAMPGQGIFIGEPLARPFAGFQSDYRDTVLRVHTRLIEPGVYSVQASRSMVGPYKQIARMPIGWGGREISMKGVKSGYFRFERLPDKNRGP